MHRWTAWLPKQVSAVLQNNVFVFIGLLLVRLLQYRHVVKVNIACWFCADKLDVMLAKHDAESSLMHTPIIRVPPIVKASTAPDTNGLRTASIGRRHGISLTDSIANDSFETFGKGSTSSAVSKSSVSGFYSGPGKRADSVPDLSVSNGGSGQSVMMTISLTPDTKVPPPRRSKEAVVSPLAVSSQPPTSIVIIFEQCAVLR
jgi:hypothetical protein